MAVTTEAGQSITGCVHTEEAQNGSSHSVRLDALAVPTWWWHRPGWLWRAADLQTVLEGRRGWVLMLGAERWYSSNRG